jgi:hypothetical protein
VLQLISIALWFYYLHMNHLLRKLEEETAEAETDEFVSM